MYGGYIMKDVICLKCGVINEFYTLQKNTQLTAWCSVCKSYIKNIPQGGEPTLHFGKYKDRTIASMIHKDEVSYLHWLIKSEIKLTETLKETIKKHLNI